MSNEEYEFYISKAYRLIGDGEILYVEDLSHPKFSSVVPYKNGRKYNVRSSS